MLKRVTEVIIGPNDDALEVIDKEVKAINDTVGSWNHDVKLFVKGTQATDDGWHRVTAVRLEVHDLPTPNKNNVRAIRKDPMLRIPDEHTHLNVQ